MDELLDSIVRAMVLADIKQNASPEAKRQMLESLNDDGEHDCDTCPSREHCLILDALTVTDEEDPNLHLVDIPEDMDMHWNNGMRHDN